MGAEQGSRMFLYVQVRLEVRDPEVRASLETIASSFRWDAMQATVAVVRAVGIKEHTR